jgi:hypothetical protein
MVFTGGIQLLIVAQMYSVTASWRWGAWIPLIFASLGFFMVLFQYHPPPRTNSLDLSRFQIFSRVDYIGGILSISGIALLMDGLQMGGYTRFVYAPNLELMVVHGNLKA